MGHHYLPQFYLRGFTVDNMIWVHDRQQDHSFVSQPKSIANENDLYTEELEQHLANDIEDPAKAAIEKIRECSQLNLEDRLALASYVVALWKRVPEGRARASAAIPEVSASLRKEIHADLANAALRNPSLTAVAEERKAQVNRILDRYEQERPPDIWQQNLVHGSSSNAVDSLLSMQWRFLKSDSLQFLTCDNPVFFFAHEGIGRPSSELTIPFSSTVCLWANRQPLVGHEYISALSGAVREINRRTATNASRFVFSKRQESWILPFVRKGRYQLSRMR